MKRFVFMILFFGYIQAEEIWIYNCYGNDSRLIVEGRVLNEREFAQTKEDDGIFTNLWRKLGYIFNDEVKNKKLILKSGSREFEKKSDDEGYFEFDLSMEENSLKSNQKIYLRLKEKKEIRNSCNAFVPTRKKQVGIISDFDDTVIISEVTNKAALLKQLLLKNYKQRKAVEGMKKRFEEILKNSPDKALFIITGSPKQFNIPIDLFLDYHDFPKRTIIAKKIHGKNSNPLFRQKDFKSKKTETLLRLYPNIEWVLFGDNTEEDREIYLNIAKKYPSRIKEIYIRDVKSDHIEKIYP